MHIIIDNYGVKLEAEQEMFKLMQGEEVRRLSPLKVSSINFLKNGSITTAALQLAARNQVPVLVYNSRGKVQAWVWSPKYGSIATIRRNQAFFTRSAQGIVWAAKLIVAKISRQSSNLKWLCNRVPSQSVFLTGKANTLDEYANKMAGIHLEGLQFASTAEYLRGTEGIASREYWQCLAQVMRPYIFFEGRGGKGARDRFNICLNYCYGILYGVVESSLLMCGVDPYMGVIHTDRHNRPTMAYDHIEPFRPWIDKMLIDLFLKKMIDDGHFQSADEGEGAKRVLSLTGRKLLLEHFFEMMSQRAYLNNKRIKLSDHVHYASSELSGVLKKFQYDT